MSEFFELLVYIFSLVFSDNFSVILRPKKISYIKYLSCLRVRKLSYFYIYAILLTAVMVKTHFGLNYLPIKTIPFSLKVSQTLDWPSTICLLLVWRVSVFLVCKVCIVLLKFASHIPHTHFFFFSLSPSLFQLFLRLTVTRWIFI